MSNIIDRILAEVCLDERIQDGIFDMSNNTHMDVLRENMVDKFNISLNDVRGIHNKMLEGKYPERQAYNKDGLLVTFPTPQHKAKAISRGTHFEQDPTKGDPNVFGGGSAPQAGQQPAGGQPPAGGAPPAGGEAPTPNVFGGEPAAPAPEKPATPPPAAPAAPAGQSAPSSLPKSDTPPPAPAAPSAPSPAPAAGGSALPASDIAQKTQSAASDTQGLEVEPATPTQPGQPEQPLPPPNFDNPKPQEQRSAEAQVVKQMMAGDPNNPTLSPTMPLNVNEQMNNVLNFAKNMGYASAVKVISEVMNRK